LPAPFYNNIKGTTSGAAGTGAYTPSAAATGYLAWSTVPVWIGLVRFEDSGGAWELSYCYWNGTTLSRSTNQFVASSSGSPLSLTSAATAAMVPDASEVQPHIGGNHWSLWTALWNSTTISAIGIAAPTATGTPSAATCSTGSLRGEQKRVTLTSATTANAQTGYSSTEPMAPYVTSVAGQGGFEFVARWACASLPTGPRMFVGLTSVTMVGNTAEPSALVANVCAFEKDSTDTNIQFVTNDNSGGGNKTDTGIAMATNGVYEMSIWAHPGGSRVYALLIRLDTGAIWYGSTTTQLPVNGAIMFPQLLWGLSSTTGTAIVTTFTSMSLRGGS